MRSAIIETIGVVLAVAVIGSVLEYCVIVAFTDAIDDAAAAMAPRVVRTAR